MTMTLSGDGTITGLVAGGLPNATVTADDLAAGAALNSVSDGVFFRNRIINGDMRIDQRNAGAAVTVNTDAIDLFSTDRFYGSGVASDGVFTLQQSTTAPTGFNYSVKATVTTADASISSTERYFFAQKIEGYNVADLNFGTANAKTVSLSFWVQSSLTGTFGGSLRNDAVDRSYPFTYTISAANTWEYKTVTITGDTSGTWLKTNGAGLLITWSLGTGSSRVGTAGAWAAANYFSATGETALIGTLNATWYITGVQLEVGNVATPFERRPYGTELALCQRYYQKAQKGDYAGRSNGTTTAILGIPLLVAVRASPTLSDGGTTYLYSGGARVNSTGGTLTVLNFELETTSLQTSRTGFTGLTDDRAYNGVFTSTVTISAEL